MSSADEPTAENDVPGLIDRIAEVLNVHRWKSMGVRSVECECGKVISQGAQTPTLGGFPADEAFRRHIAAEVARLIPPGGPPTEDSPIIHRPGCSWETSPYCGCGADPERVIPPGTREGDA